MQKNYCLLTCRSYLQSYNFAPRVPDRNIGVRAAVAVRDIVRFSTKIS